SCSKSRKRVSEIADARRLVYRHGSRIGYAGQVDGVGVIDSPATGEVLVGKKRINRWPAAVDLDGTSSPCWCSGAGLIGCGRCSPGIGRFNQIEIRGRWR